MLAILRRFLDRQVFVVGSALVVRGAGSVSQFVLNVVLGRVLGAEGLGVYYLFTSWMSILGTLEGLGLPLYVLRTVSSLEAQQRRLEARRLVLIGLVVVLGVGSVLVLVLLVSSAPIAEFLLRSVRLSYVLSAAAVGSVLYAARRILSESLKAYGRPNLALVIEFSFVPSGLLLVIGLFALLDLPVELTSLLWMYIFFLLSGVVIAGGNWHRLASFTRTPRPIAGSLRGLYNFRSIGIFWAMELLSMGFMTLPFVLLPYFSTPSDIGRFGAAHRLVSLAGTILSALAGVFSPRFARSFVLRDFQTLARDLRASQVYSFLVYVPFFIAFSLFPKSILTLFGSEFREGFTLLWILAVGQLVKSIAGLSGDFLNMVRQEHYDLMFLALSVISFVGLAVLLGPSHGVIGVAWAYTVVVVARNIALLVTAWRTIKVLETGGANGADA